MRLCALASLQKKLQAILPPHRSTTEAMEEIYHTTVTLEDQQLYDVHVFERREPKWLLRITADRQDGSAFWYASFSELNIDAFLEATSATARAIRNLPEHLMSCMSWEKKAVCLGHAPMKKCSKPAGMMRTPSISSISSMDQATTLTPLNSNSSATKATHASSATPQVVSSSSSGGGSSTRQDTQPSPSLDLAASFALHVQDVGRQWDVIEDMRVLLEEFRQEVATLPELYHHVHSQNEAQLQDKQQLDALAESVRELRGQVDDMLRENKNKRVQPALDDTATERTSAVNASVSPQNTTTATASVSASAERDVTIGSRNRNDDSGHGNSGNSDRRHGSSAMERELRQLTREVEGLKNDMALIKNSQVQDRTDLDELRQLHFEILPWMREMYEIHRRSSHRDAQVAFDNLAQKQYEKQRERYLSATRQWKR